MADQPPAPPLAERMRMWATAMEAQRCNVIAGQIRVWADELDAALQSVRSPVSEPDAAASIRALLADWRKRRYWLNDHRQHEIGAADQAHVYGRCIDELEALLASPPPVSPRVLELAKDMAGYIHHSGYPRYDGGHSEPENACQHADCVAVREASAPVVPPSLAALLERLWKYAKHTKDCDVVTEEHPKYNPCSCGLDDIRREREALSVRCGRMLHTAPVVTPEEGK